MANESALFLDYDNIHIGMEQTFGALPDVHILAEAIKNHFKQSGDIIIKKAYGDWERYMGVPATLQREQIEPVYIGAKRNVGIEVTRIGTAKNAADIQLALDAQELIYSKPNISTFILISGDYDFVPLVMRLHENSKHICISGISARTSKELIQMVGSEFFISIDELLGLKALNVPKLSTVDWQKFVTCLDQREKGKMPFIARKLFTTQIPSTILGKYDSPEGRQMVVGESLVAGITELYYVPNPVVTGTNTAAIKLNRNNDFVLSVLGVPKNT